MSDDDDAPAEPAGSNGHPLASSVLVLNRDYVAIRIIPARRAFSLLFKSAAEAVDRENGSFGAYDFPRWVDRSLARRAQPLDHEEFVRTPRFALLVPRVIRLVSYGKVHRTEVRVSRRNVLARDEHRCQYCGKTFPVADLSIDHVVPRSRGGQATWSNVVTACTRCNTRKGGRLPAEASMKLQRPPVAPKRNPVVVDKVRLEKYGVWRYFLGDGAPTVDS